MGFEEEVSAFVGKTGNRLRLVRRKIILDVCSRVILRTPVGFPPSWTHKAPPGYAGGHARANWQASMGSPAGGVVEGIDPTGQEALAAAMAVSEGIGNDDRPYFLTNNLPYIDRLENGWSHQAPAGMVGITVAEFEGIAERAAAQIEGGSD